MTKEERDQIHEDGSRAYLTGMVVNLNPHSETEEPEKFHEWRRGYYDAEWFEND